MMQDHMGMHNEPTGDEHHLRTLLRHFWDRAYAFYRNWTASNQKYIMKQVFVGVNYGDRPHIRSLLDEAFIEAEDPCIIAVEKFTRL